MSTELVSWSSWLVGWLCLTGATINVVPEGRPVRRLRRPGHLEVQHGTAAVPPGPHPLPKLACGAPQSAHSRQRRFLFAPKARAQENWLSRPLKTP
jgi:hypothetical protein